MVARGRGLPIPELRIKPLDVPVGPPVVAKVRETRQLVGKPQPRERRVGTVGVAGGTDRISADKRGAIDELERALDAPAGIALDVAVGRPDPMDAMMRISLPRFDVHATPRGDFTRPRSIRNFTYG